MFQSAKISAIISGVGVAFIAWLIHMVLIGNLEDDFRQRIKDEQAACTKAQTELKGKNDELQKNLADNAARTLKYKRLYAGCVVPQSGELPASGAGPSGGAIKGISTDWLWEQAKQCADYRSQLISAGAPVRKPK